MRQHGKEAKSCDKNADVQKSKIHGTLLKEGENMSLGVRRSVDGGKEQEMQGPRALEIVREAGAVTWCCS